MRIEINDAVAAIFAHLYNRRHCRKKNDQLNDVNDPWCDSAIRALLIAAKQFPLLLSAA